MSTFFNYQGIIIFFVFGLKKSATKRMNQSFRKLSIGRQSSKSTSGTNMRHSLRHTNGISMNPNGNWTNSHLLILELTKFMIKLHAHNRMLNILLDNTHIHLSPDLTFLFNC